MSSTSNSLRRLLPRRTWKDKSGLGLIIWSVVAAIALIFGLVVITLLIDLLFTQGELSVRERVHALNQGIIPADFSRTKDLGLLTEGIRFSQLFLWKWVLLLAIAVPWLQSAYGAIIACIVAGLVLASVYGIAQNRAYSCASKTSHKLSSWLRNSIHRQTLRLGPSDFSGQRHQSALKLFVDETEDLRETVEKFRYCLVRGSVFIPVLLLSVLLIDWRLGLQCLIPAGVCWMIYRYQRRKGSAERQLADAHAETEVRFLAEGLKQTRLVRGYNLEEFEQKLFDKHFARLTQERAAGRKLESVAIGTAKLAVRAGLAIILLLISVRVISPTNPLMLANAVAFAVALIWLFLEVSRADQLSLLRSKIEITGERIYRFLDEVPEVGQAVGAKFVEPVAKSIILEAVHYRQQGHEILRGIDLRITAKSQVALVSLDPLLPQAVAYLLPRFIEPTRGRVLFDGEDIAWGTLESVHAEVAYVGKDDPCLSGTVLENLICGDQRFNLQDAVEAAKLTHIHKMISSLSQGYETVLGEHGEQLQAGDLFRLSLARAALRDPAVIIIDEPKIALDDDTKAFIDDTYQRLSQKHTLVFLPGRLSTVRRCDQVVLLHEGKVEGVGSHVELSKSSDLYRHWDYLTFNTFSRRTRQLKPK